MKQKLLFLLASLLLPLAANAYDACIDGIYYNIVKKAKQATVTYGDSESGTYSGNVVIPAMVLRAMSLPLGNMLSEAVL